MDQFHPTADVAIHAELQKNAQDNSRKSENLESRIDLLEKKYSKLSDVTEALWQILQTKLELNDDLLRKEITLTIEKKTSRKTPKAQCYKCQQTSPITTGKCIYCGTAFANLPARDPFDF
jgi:TolA-binding protein